MSDLSPKIQNILEAITQAARDNKLDAYLCGEIAKFFYINDYKPLPANVVDVILSYTQFDTYRFYKSLTKYITINKEVESSSGFYSIVSGDYLVNFHCKEGFDPANVEQISQLFSFTIDSVVVNVKNKQIIDPYNICDQKLSIKNVKPHNQWNLDDILGFALKSGLIPEISVDAQQLSFLNTISLKDIKPTLGSTIKDLLVDILLTRQPGISLKLICDSISDGKEWLISQLIDLTISLNVSIKEEINPSQIISDKKLELINIYNEFFLHDKKQPETTKEKNHRLLTTLRLLLDTPSLTIDTPYIDRVSAFMAIGSGDDDVEGMSIQLFDDPCPYPPCSPCDPAECETTGPPCCCCSSVDIISAAKVQCHEQITMSCTPDGLGPGPGDDGSYVSFPSGCTVCAEGCEYINDGRLCSGTFPEWWPIVPPTPCECTVIDDQHGNPLTCVTCDGANKFCESILNVTGEDCHYEITLSPSSGCCGSPAAFDVMFVIDVSASMANEIASVRSGIIDFIELGETHGILSKLSLTTFKDDVTFHGWNADGTFGSSAFTAPGPVDYTTDKNAFEAQVETLTAVGGAEEFQFRAIHQTLVDYTIPPSYTKVVIVVTDEMSATPPTMSEVITLANYMNTKIMYIGPINGNQELAIQTGGLYWQITDSLDWSEVFSSIASTAAVLPSSCDCIDSTSIPVLYLNPALNCNCPEDPTGVQCLADGTIDDECRFIPITKRLKGDETTNCDLEWNLNACGHTITVTPEDVNEVCCGDLTGFGCDCAGDNDPPACCGASCQEICHPLEPKSLYNTLEDAQSAAWFNCLQEAAYQINDDCWAFADGSGGFTTKCKSDVDDEVATAFAGCFVSSVEPIDWDCTVAPKCDIVDEVLPSPLQECLSVRHPSVVILNNGIGLVAYESHEATPVIKLAQFKTSADHKFLINRIFNHGRLEHFSKWSDDRAKLYVYDDPIPEALLQGIGVGETSEDTWKDVVAFKSGPLQGQCFPLANLASGVPYGTDSIGTFLLFYIGTSTLSQDFSSVDDVYNIQWYVYDLQSVGDLVGDAIAQTGENPQIYPYEQYLFTSRAGVDAILSGERITSHIYNGEAVPVAHPSISTAYNYSQGIENSHFVYLTYQALEDQKWQVYLRQIRLSEYQHDVQVADAVSGSALIPISEVSDSSEVIYRAVCNSDECSDLGEAQFLLQRTVVFEVLLTDGREVLNPIFDNPTDTWSSLCPKVLPEEFPKRKVFVQFVHSAVADRCPDQFGMDEIFQNWQTGETFTVPASIDSAQSLLLFLQTAGDSSIETGQFDPSITLGEVSISSSSIGAIWYEDPDDSEWSVINDSAFTSLSTFKGFDVSEPILLSADSTGHATNPVVQVGYNNEVYVVYEYTDTTDIHNIRILGTLSPTDMLPAGVHSPRDIDGSLNYFLQRDDFIYSKNITNSTDSLDQLPSMYIDLNDVIHLTWQSNRDKRWEIYYANSLTAFQSERITNYESKSLKPSITGNNLGYLFITWHDDRFDHYEIMMTYKTEDRVIPLHQQDPYLASLRNFPGGWQHTTGVIPFTITNDTGSGTCFSNFEINFYTDRLLGNLAFTVSYGDFPFAFQLPEISSDTSTKNLDDFAEWLSVEDLEFDSSSYLLSRKCVVATSPESDAFTDDSLITSITMPNLGSSYAFSVLQIRASNTPNDPASADQWVSTSVASRQGDTIDVSGLGVSGRYQQFRLSYCVDIDTQVYSLNNNTDDADLENSDRWENDNDDLRWGKDSSENTFDSYLRYQLDIAQRSEIVDAFLSVIALSTGGGNDKANIKLLDYDNTLAFSGTTSLSLTVSSDGDDADVRDNVAWDASDLSVRVGQDSDGNTYDAYLRFPINIPVNADILSAKLVFTSTSNQAGPLSSKVKLVNSVNVGTFQDSSTYTAAIPTGLSDAYESIGGSSPGFYTSHDYLVLGRSDVDSSHNSFLRFPVDIPKGSNITNSYIQWTIFNGFASTRTRIHLLDFQDMGEFSPTITTINADQDAQYDRVYTGRPPDGLWDNIDCISMVHRVQGWYYTTRETWSDIIWQFSFPSGVIADELKLYVRKVGGSHALGGANVGRVLSNINCSTPDHSHIASSTAYLSGETNQWNEVDLTAHVAGMELSNIKGFGGSLVSFDPLFPNAWFTYFSTGSVFVPYVELTYRQNLIVQPEYVNWVIPGSSPGSVRTSPDIGSLVRSWLDLQDSGYTSGNFMGLKAVATETFSVMSFSSFEDDTYTDPTLTIEYGPSALTTTSTEVDWTITPWADGSQYNTPDLSVLIEEYLSLDNYDASGQYMGLCIKHDSQSGLREFDSYEANISGGTGARLEITYQTPDERITTSATVEWVPSIWYENESFNTSDISVLVQEYIDRSGYNPGQHMGLVMEDSGSVSLRRFSALDIAYLNGTTLTISSIPESTWTFAVASQSPPRVCLLHGESAIGYLDITPTLRIDANGNTLTESPLPLDYIPNNTYFIEAVATPDAGVEQTFDQKLSASCLECIRNPYGVWDFESCSLNVSILNDTGAVQLYNLRLRFYTDQEKLDLTYEMSTFSWGNINYFTIGNAVPAVTVWSGNIGYSVPSGKTFEITAWPQLDINTGLICGIKYWVEVTYCLIDESSTESCQIGDLIALDTREWTCDCNSLRWDDRFENAPDNLFELVKWKSSANGSSDIRITETKSDNLNAVIKMRNNYSGIVLYETNREKRWNEGETFSVDTDYKVYASVFSVQPSMFMYASNTEAITSPFSQIIHRSDIEMCPTTEGSTGCYDSNGNRKVIYGFRPALDIDQYDNIFLSMEQTNVQPDSINACDNFKKGNERKILVHRCGIESSELLFGLPTTTAEEDICKAEGIFDNIYTDVDPIFASTVRLIRVKNEFVRYHITRNNVASPVVGVCNIQLEVIGSPASVALRLRNGEEGTEKWSGWVPFEPAIGKDTVDIAWTLEQGSGSKIIQIQVATSEGMTGTASITVIADYFKISHEIKFYRAIEVTPKPPEPIEISHLDTADIWDDANQLLDLNNVPIASMREPEMTTVGEGDDAVPTIITRDADYIFVEIIPDLEYMSQFADVSDEDKLAGTGNGCISPTFDFIQQGDKSIYDLPTKWRRNIKNQEVFRWYITIHKDDTISFKDGLAYVVPHFKNDCSDAFTTVSSICGDDTSREFDRDDLNRVVSQSNQPVDGADVWSSERDEIGRIRDPIVIRPNEDPYFVFGDPKYRLKNESD